MSSVFPCHAPSSNTSRRTYWLERESLWLFLAKCNLWSGLWYCTSENVQMRLTESVREKYHSKMLRRLCNEVFRVYLRLFTTQHQHRIKRDVWRMWHSSFIPSYFFISGRHVKHCLPAKAMKIVLDKRKRTLIQVVMRWAIDNWPFMELHN